MDINDIELGLKKIKAPLRFQKDVIEKVVSLQNKIIDLENQLNKSKTKSIIWKSLAKEKNKRIKNAIEYVSSIFAVDSYHKAIMFPLNKIKLILIYKRK